MSMPPEANIELELHRLGGIGGVIKLLRQPAVGESSAVYTGRIELGAALLACKIGLRNSCTKCGANVRRLQQTDCSVVKSSVVTLETNAFIAALSALHRGGCSPKARAILLRVVASLGSRAPQTDTTPQLFDMLSDGIKGNDMECCRCITRALALCLHESSERARASACDVQRVALLLKLALPGRLQPPKAGEVRREASARATAGGSRAFDWDNASITDRQTRENSLSCLCSMIKVDTAAADGILVAGGLRPLYALALGEEPYLDGDERPLTPQGKSGRRRPRTSVSNPPASGPSGAAPSISVASGGMRPRPAAKTGSPLVDQPCLGLRDETTGGESVPAPLADSEIRESLPMTEGSRDGGGTKPGVRPSGKVGRPAPTQQSPSTPPSSGETEALPFKSPPPLRQGSGRSVASKEEDLGVQPALQPPAEAATHPSDGGETPAPHARMAALAAAILVACLRRERPRSIAEMQRRGGEDRPTAIRGRAASSSGSCDACHEDVSGKTVTAAAGGSLAAAAEEGASPCGRAGPPTPPPPPLLPTSAKKKSQSTRRHSRADDTTGAFLEGGGKNAAMLAAPPQRQRRRRSRGGKKGSLSLRFGRRETGKTTAGSGAPDFAHGTTRAPPPDSIARDGADSPALGETSGRILGSVAGDSSAPSGGDGGSAAMERWWRHRRAEVTSSGFSELERLGPITRAPELLNAPSHLLQELGVLFLELGMGELAVEEEEEAEEEDKNTQTGHDDDSRWTGPSKSKRTHRQRQQLIRSVVAGGGTALRSLCWMLLHRRREISEGAAAVLIALTIPSSRRRHGPANIDSAGTAAAAEWVLLTFIEQGCVPILRMAAGRPAVLTLSPEGDQGKGDAGTAAAATGEAAPLTTAAAADAAATRAARAEPAAVAAATITAPALAGVAAAGVAAEAGAGAEAGTGGCGGLARWAARAILEAVAEEACGRHADRLVHAVSSSGNPELRANVALALGIMSAGPPRTNGGKAWRSLVSEGALAAVLGMLRSPTGRPAAVSFLQLAASLLEGVPAPPDSMFFGGSLAADEGEEAMGNGREDDGIHAGERPSGGNDTVVLVRDPLSSLRMGSGSRGGQAEAEGIKMACPPVEVICRASPVLRRVVLNTPEGRLPLLRGRYRTWEEVMAHMAAPHTFAATKGNYSTEFLIEMFVLAASFEIEAQADGYAHEARRRLGCLRPATRTAGPSKTGDAAPLPTTMRTSTGADHTATGPSSSEEKCETPSGATIGGGGGDGSEVPGPDVLGLLDVEHYHDVACKTIGHAGIFGSGDKCDGSGSGSGGGNGGGGASGTSTSIRRGNGHHQDKSAVFEVLEAALRCRHGWLCDQAFRDASAMMGSGGGEGLPSAPRELTSVLALLRQFLSLVWVVDDHQKGGRSWETGNFANGREK